MTELVVLVDENNKQIGTADKKTVHTRSTPLHRGFSLFLFNSKKQILLTKRASGKTFGGVWSNTVCGHPGVGESVVDASARRLKDELGIIVGGIREISSYRYQFSDREGIMENEICPILIAKSDAYPVPNPVEIEEWKWVLWTVFLQEIKDDPQKYSPWSVEEAVIVENYLKLI